MTSDATLSRELMSLQQEAALSRQRRKTTVETPVGVPPARAKPAEPAATDAAADEDWNQELNAELRALADEVTGFFAETEKNIAAHPASSVAGAFVLGILVGRLIGR